MLISRKHVRALQETLYPRSADQLVMRINVYWSFVMSREERATGPPDSPMISFSLLLRVAFFVGVHAGLVASVVLL